MTGAVFEALIATPEVLAVFEAGSVVQALLEVEAHVLRARAAEGQLSAGAAQAIAGVCKAALFDVPALVDAARRAGGLAEPLLTQLAATVALFDPEAATQVPRSDPGDAVAQTAMALLVRRALALIDRDLARVGQQLLALGRDPGPLLRSQRRLHELAPAALQLVLAPERGGGGEAVGARVAHALQLAWPAGPDGAAADEWMRLHAEVGLLCAQVCRLAAEHRGGESPSAAPRAPYRVAALLGLMAQPAAPGAQTVHFAETASLYLEAHGQLTTLASALDTALGTALARPSDAAVRGGSATLPIPEPHHAALFALARHQAAQAPWARFLPESLA